MTVPNKEEDRQSSCYNHGNTFKVENRKFFKIKSWTKKSKINNLTCNSNQIYNYHS